MVPTSTPPHVGGTHVGLLWASPHFGATHVGLSPRGSYPRGTHIDTLPHGSHLRGIHIGASHVGLTHKGATWGGYRLLMSPHVLVRDGTHDVAEKPSVPYHGRSTQNSTEVLGLLNVRDAVKISEEVELVNQRDCSLRIARSVELDVGEVLCADATALLRQGALSTSGSAICRRRGALSTNGSALGGPWRRLGTIVPGLGCSRGRIVDLRYSLQNRVHGGLESLKLGVRGVSPFLESGEAALPPGVFSFHLGSIVVTLDLVR
mmetsp:Transcript_42143/g.82439  ORF Transcript_42143/g.82439 Transcript_42143/m.82439 type:complete len:262 (-) Transcript_42143:1070-1855(-)